MIVLVSEDQRMEDDDPFEAWLNRRGHQARPPPARQRLGRGIKHGWPGYIGEHYGGGEKGEKQLGRGHIVFLE
jgi:hypothetical protein